MSIEFDNEAHELFLAERFERIARIETFDKLVDMALDGVITMEEAITEWKAEFIEEDDTIKIND